MNSIKLSFRKYGDKGLYYKFVSDDLDNFDNLNSINISNETISILVENNYKKKLETIYKLLDNENYVIYFDDSLIEISKYDFYSLLFVNFNEEVIKYFKKNYTKEFEESLFLFVYNEPEEAKRSIELLKYLIINYIDQFNNLDIDAEFINKLEYHDFNNLVSELIEQDIDFSHENIDIKKLSNLITDTSYICKYFEKRNYPLYCKSVKFNIYRESDIIYLINKFNEKFINLNIEEYFYNIFTLEIDFIDKLAEVLNNIDQDRLSDINFNFIYFCKNDEYTRYTLTILLNYLTEFNIALNFTDLNIRFYDPLLIKAIINYCIKFDTHLYKANYYYNKSTLDLYWKYFNHFKFSKEEFDKLLCSDEETVNYICDNYDLTKFKLDKQLIPHRLYEIIEQKLIDIKQRKIKSAAK